MKKILFSSDVLMAENEERFAERCSIYKIDNTPEHFLSWRDVSQTIDGQFFWDTLSERITYKKARFAINSYHKYYGSDIAKGFTIRNKQKQITGLSETLKFCLAPHIPFKNKSEHTFVIYAEDTDTLVVEDRYSECKEVFKIKLLSNRGKLALMNGLKTPFSRKHYFARMHLAD